MGHVQVAKIRAIFRDICWADAIGDALTAIIGKLRNYMPGWLGNAVFGKQGGEIPPSLPASA